MSQILAKVLYGSHLYGTNIPTSDIDHRSVYLPPLQDLILQRAKDAWEDKSVDDTSVFSLQHFCRLAAQGQSIAIEMLAADGENVVGTSPVWQTLHDNRKRFYTKSMHSFLGYAKTMAGKYSLRIGRLNETEAILKVFDQIREGSDAFLLGRLGAIWAELPESLNAVKTTNARNSGADQRVYQVCGREIQATTPVSIAYEVIKGIHDSYGERVRAAKEGRIDWKALMHAFRAALQCKEIVETGDLRFPLHDAEWLRELRLGKIDFLQAGLDKQLDDLIAEVQQKMDASTLPERVSQDWLDEIVLSAYA